MLPPSFLQIVHAFSAGKMPQTVSTSPATVKCTSNPAKGTDVSHHNPKFDVDEDVLWEGSAVFVAIVEEFLNK